MCSSSLLSFMLIVYPCRHLLLQLNKLHLSFISVINERMYCHIYTESWNQFPVVLIFSVWAAADFPCVHSLSLCVCVCVYRLLLHSWLPQRENVRCLLISIGISHSLHLSPWVLHGTFWPVSASPPGHGVFPSKLWHKLRWRVSGSITQKRRK